MFRPQDLDLCPGFTSETAAFIADQIGRRPRGEAVAPLQERRLAVLGLQPGSPLPLPGEGHPGRWPGLDALRLCAQLLRHGAQLAVLDRPRNRMLIERLLPLAADSCGRIAGTVRLERDLSDACRCADAVLLLPGWRAERPLAWGVLSDRLRPGAQVFDLRPDAPPERAVSCGLRIWHLGSFTAVF